MNNEKNFKIIVYSICIFVLIYLVIIVVTMPDKKLTKQEEAQLLIEHGSGSSDPWE